MSEKILEVKHLETSFFTHAGEVKAVRDVSFSVNKGEILGIRFRKKCQSNVSYEVD